MPLLRSLNLKAFVIVGVVFVAWLTWSAKPFFKRYEEQRLQLGTVVQIALVGSLSSDRAEELLRMCFDRVDDMDQVFSSYRPDSELMQLNAQAGQTVVVSEALFAVLKSAVAMAQATEGAFDITVGPWLDLWDRMEEEQRLPSDYELASVLERIGSSKISLEDATRTVLMAPGMKIVLGGIAKGYILESLKQFLLSAGVDNGLVNIGGDLIAWGKNEHGQPWQIALSDPHHPEEPLGRMAVSGGVLVTSGDYQRYRTIAGVHYSHIIDPRTGWPVEGSSSISVMGRDAMAVDAWATALSVMGPEQSLRLLREQEALDYWLFFEGKDAIMSRPLGKGR